MEITELQKEDEKAWDSYVLNSNTSTFYHQIGWKNMVEKTYKHRPIYLVAKEDGEIKGILPLFLMKSMVFGKKLVSVPFAPYGGVCAFYKMFAHNMRDLGSPAHSNNFFENILHEFPDNSKVLTVKRDDNVLYAAFYLFFKDTVINSWSSTLEEYRKFYPTDFGIWNAIKIQILQNTFFLQILSFSKTLGHGLSD